MDSATSASPQQAPHSALQNATTDCPTPTTMFMGPFPQAPQPFMLQGEQAVQVAPLGKGNELHFALPPDTAVFLNEESYKTTWSVQETAIVLEFYDDSRITITNFLNPPNNKYPTLILQDGREVAGEDLVHAMEWADKPLGN